MMSPSDTWGNHIPSDFVVDQEALDVESSSDLEFLVLHNV